MTTSEQALTIIREAEGLRLHAYLCPAGVWTIGYGHTAGVTPDLTITPEQAEQLLRQDIAPVESVINALNASLQRNHRRPSLRQGQFDALVSFTYNVGLAAFRNSTLYRLILQGSDDRQITAQFARWNRAGGKVLPGLTARRAKEAALWNQ